MRMADDVIRLHHMHDAAKKAIEFSKEKYIEEFESDEMLHLSVIRLLEVVGEAAYGVTESFQQKHPEIPWKEICGTRNRLIHGYFDVDIDIVWSIVSDDLPSLVANLEKIISQVDCGD